MKIGLLVVRQIRHQLFCNPVHILKRNKTHSQWILKKKDIMETPPCRENPIITKLDSPEFHSIFTDELKCLTDMFKRHHHEIRVAGGAVRDILMKIQPTDLDFATTATPEQMKEMFTKEEVRMINDNGEKHGTITCRLNDKENFEVTTLRIDILTDGRHAEVAFTTDWKLDANRRDLTINSMFLDFEGNVYDYFFGFEDLQKRRVVFVGDARIRIKEDFLRILRYFRFYGRIAAEPDQHDDTTIQAIKENVEGLSRISGERIWMELNKILEGNYARELINKIIECGMGKYIGFPENPNVENFNNVLLRAKSNNVTLLPCTALAALFNDANEVLNLHMRLKLSAFNRDLLFFLAEHKDKYFGIDNIKPYQSILLNEIGKREVKREFIIQMLKYKGDLDNLEKFQNWQVPHFPVGGNVVKTYATNPKIIGIVIKRLKNIWLDHDFKLSKDELVDLIPGIVEEIDKTNVKKMNVRNK